MRQRLICSACACYGSAANGLAAASSRSSGGGPPDAKGARRRFRRVAVGVCPDPACESGWTPDVRGVGGSHSRPRGGTTRRAQRAIGAAPARAGRVTVLDTSGVIDFLLADGAADQVGELLAQEGPLAAPDVLVFEVLAVLRRDALRGALDPDRGRTAVDDLGELAIDLFPSLALRQRAWQLRDNLTAADALFVALAQQLGEPLATKDRALAAAARRHAEVEVVVLTTP